MSNLPTSFCIDIVAEKEHKRLQEYKDWYRAQEERGVYTFVLQYYGMSDGVLANNDKPFGKHLTLARFFELLAPKPYTISDLANGVCAVENDGTVDELQKVLSAAFPNDETDIIANKQLQKNKYFISATGGFWGWVSEADLPTQSVKLFLAELEKPEPITSINVGDETKDNLGKVEVSEFELQLNEVLDNIKSILLNKNRKYGDAALNPLKIFSKGSVSNLLDVRIDDKLSRIANRQNDEDEDLEVDLIGYLILKQIQNNK